MDGGRCITADPAPAGRRSPGSHMAAVVRRTASAAPTAAVDAVFRARAARSCASDGMAAVVRHTCRAAPASTLACLRRSRCTRGATAASMGAALRDIPSTAAEPARQCVVGRAGAALARTRGAGTGHHVAACLRTACRQSVRGAVAARASIVTQSLRHHGSGRQPARRSQPGGDPGADRAAEAVLPGHADGLGAAFVCGNLRATDQARAGTAPLSAPCGPRQWVDGWST